MKTPIFETQQQLNRLKYASLLVTTVVAMLCVYTFYVVTFVVFNESAERFKVESRLFFSLMTAVVVLALYLSVNDIANRRFGAANAEQLEKLSKHLDTINDIELTQSVQLAIKNG